MPFYEIILTIDQIQHTYPLTPTQKHSIARSITHLHSTTFLTPSLFVNVVFQYLPASSSSASTNPADSTANEQEDDPTYYLAGDPVSHHPHGPNRILAQVRTSPARTKAIFDDLATRIEKAWYDAVNFDPSSDTQKDKAAKKMHMITFYPMIAARENGVTIPDAGNESSWLKDNMPYFKSQAYDHGDQDFKKMVEEIDHRDDLKAMLK
ncbi:hypothetical protein RBB50_002426 [Rhinocladiella similis]